MSMAQGITIDSTQQQRVGLQAIQFGAVRHSKNRGECVPSAVPDGLCVPIAYLKRKRAQAISHLSP